jgi:hypothetical protein
MYFNQKNQTKNMENDVREFLKNNRADLNFFKYPLKKFNQIYRKYMKKLFCFNGFGAKEIFFFLKDIKILILLLSK